jgi:hypothetical protein
LRYALHWLSDNGILFRTTGPIRVADPIRILIASPGDIADERKAVRAAFGRGERAGRRRRA